MLCVLFTKNVPIEKSPFGAVPQEEVENTARKSASGESALGETANRESATADKRRLFRI